MSLLAQLSLYLNLFFLLSIPFGFFHAPKVESIAFREELEGEFLLAYITQEGDDRNVNQRLKLRKNEELQIFYCDFNLYKSHFNHEKLFYFFPKN